MSGFTEWLFCEVLGSCNFLDQIADNIRPLTDKFWHIVSMPEAYLKKQIDI